MEELSAAALEIFGYEPRPWQLKAALKLLEGHDCMVVAGTGSGKSLVFALVAIAIELTHSTGLIIVICPLKALQQDQVSMSYVVRMCSTVFTGLVGPPSECCGPYRGAFAWFSEARRCVQSESRSWSCPKSKSPAHTSDGYQRGQQ